MQNAQDSCRNSDKELIEQTITFWQPRSARELTREDARQMIENVTGFFQVLAEWDAKARVGSPSLGGGSDAIS